jgi:prepilin peptidase CpaA
MTFVEATQGPERTLRALPIAAGALAAALALTAGWAPAAAVLLAAATAASITDGLSYRIPNAAAATAAVTSVAVWVTAGAPLPAFLLALCAAAGLLGLWEAGVLGGGDVKLVPALVLGVCSTAPPAFAWLPAVMLGMGLYAFATVFAALIGERRLPLAVGAGLVLVLLATLG